MGTTGLNAPGWLVVGIIDGQRAEYQHPPSVGIGGDGDRR